jgi:tetratricopeptide (TPR) repeat protein
MLKHYRIDSRLGEGGMGVVYRATDTRLGRTVALKVLPEDLAADQEHARRFEREARAASSVTHPGIATLYDFDQEGATTFLTMEYVEGRTLRNLLGSGPLPQPQLLDCAVQVAEALAIAHSKGIVHRDLKPENVMASDSGYYKILDFGLARLTPGQMDEDSSSGQTQMDTVSREVTKAGKIVGTITYMSPEQVQGQPTDPRSDIFSFGSLLYELALGEAPFRRRNGIATFHAIVHEEAEAPGLRRAELPPEFDRIVTKCLAKSPAARYQSAADLVVDLRALRQDSESGGRSAPRLSGYDRTAPPTRRRWPAMAAVGLALAAVLLGALALGDRGVSLWGTGEAAAPVPEGDFIPAGRNRIAVAYFANNSGDPEADWLSRGLPDMLTTDLSRSPGLEVISTQRLYDLLSREGEAGEGALDRSTATELARRAGAGIVLSGSIFKPGDEYRIDVQAYDTATGQVVTAASVTGQDVFQMVDWLTNDIRRGLQYAADEGTDLRTMLTASQEAYRHYTEGTRLYQDYRFAEATAAYRRSLEADPGFAAAQLRLGMNLYLQGERAEGLPLIAEAAAQAERLPRKQRLLAEAFSAFWVEQDFRKGDERLQELVDRYPEDKEGFFWRAQALAGLAGDREGAVRMLRRVMDLDPGYTLAVTALGGHLLALDRAAESRQVLEDFLEAHPDAFGPRLLLVDVLHAEGQSQAAVAELDRIIAARPEEREPRIYKPYLLLTTFDYDGAADGFRELASSEDPLLVTAGHEGLAQVALYRGRFREAVGDYDRALASAAAMDDPRREAGLLSEKAAVLSDCGEYEAAIRSYERAARANPEGMGILGLTHVYVEMGDFDRAGETWEKTESEIHDRVTPELLAHFRAAHEADLAFHRGRFAEAEKAYRQARRLSGLPSSYSHYVGRTLQSQDRHEEAIEEFRRAVGPATREKSPLRFVKTYFFLAQSLEAVERPDEALQAYRTFLSFWGQSEDRLHEDLVGQARARVASLQA